MRVGDVMRRKNEGGVGKIGVFEGEGEEERDRPGRAEGVGGIVW